MQPGGVRARLLELNSSVARKGRACKAMATDLQDTRSPAIEARIAGGIGMKCWIDLRANCGASLAVGFVPSGGMHAHG